MPPTRTSTTLGLALAVLGCGSSGATGATYAGAADAGLEAPAEASSPLMDASTNGGSEGGPDPCGSDGGPGPITIATAAGTVADLQVEGSDVYWVDATGQIAFASVCGGPVTVLGTADAAWLPATIAVDAAHVYVTNGPSVGAFLTSNGSASSLAEVPAGQLAEALSVNAGFLYLGTGPDSSGFTGPNAGTINRAPVPNGASSVLGSSIANPQGHFAFDAQNVYWADYLGSISRMPLGGGGITSLVSSPRDFYATALAVDSTNLYWSESPVPNSAPPTAPSSGVKRQALAGGAATVLATGFVFTGMAVDAANAYWLDTAAQEVESVPVAGGPQNVLTMNEPASVGPLLDDHAVYWATGDGRIRRMAKARP